MRTGPEEESILNFALDYNNCFGGVLLWGVRLVFLIVETVLSWMNKDLQHLVSQ